MNRVQKAQLLECSSVVTAEKEAQLLPLYAGQIKL
jgi:hypothetical protein